MKMNEEQLHARISDQVREVSEPLAEKMTEALDRANEASAETKHWAMALRDVVAKQESALTQAAPEKGMTAAAIVKCIAASRKMMERPIDIAAKVYGEDSAVVKALAAGDASAGGFTIDSNFSADIIELLRNTAAVESANPRRVPLDSGTLTLPKHTSATSGAWLGENQNIVTTEPGFGQITMTAKKYAGLVPISNDLLLYSSADIDRMVRDDLVRTVRLAEDSAFLRGDGSAAEPVGMRNIPGIQEVATNGATVANITSDIGNAIQLLMQSNVDMANLHWFFTPRTWAGLFTARDGNSNPVWQAMLDRGSLYGIPFTVTNQLPNNLGSGSDESEVFLVNMSDILVGRASTLEISASSEAAYHDGSSVQASFSLDQTVVRIISRCDIAARHPASIVVVTGVAWSA